VNRSDVRVIGESGEVVWGADGWAGWVLGEFQRRLALVSAG